MEQEECPMSVILRNPQMDFLVQEMFSFYRIKEASGACPYGNDVNKWPIKWYDIIRLSELEGNRVEEAQELVRK